MSSLEIFLFGYYPYVVACVFLVGTLFRFRRQPQTWQAGSSQMLSGRGFALASNLFHGGILALLFGHIGGLLVPAQLGHQVGISDAMHQMSEIVMGGLSGCVAWIGLTLLIGRRIRDQRVRRAARRGDLGIVLLLWMTLVAGLATLPFSWQTRHEGVFLVAFNNWAQDILTFRPNAAAHAAQAPLAFKAHLVLGMTVFLVFPLTRLVHACTAPLGYLVRGHYQIVRRALPAGSLRGSGV